MSDGLPVSAETAVTTYETDSIMTTSVVIMLARVILPCLSAVIVPNDRQAHELATGRPFAQASQGLANRRTTVVCEAHETTIESRLRSLAALSGDRPAQCKKQVTGLSSVGIGGFSPCRTKNVMMLTILDRRRGGRVVLQPGPAMVLLSKTSSLQANQRVARQTLRLNTS